MKNKLKRFFTTPYVFLALQGITSIVFLTFLFILNIIPTTYFVILTIIIILLWMIPFGLQVGVRNKSFRAILSRIIASILSLIMILGSVYVNRTNNFVNRISGDSYQTTSFVVMVLEDSEITDVTQLTNKNVNINVSMQNEYSQKAKKMVDAKASNINWIFGAKYDDVANALYDKSADAIVVNLAYQSLLEENHENFESETRVIYSCDVAKTKTQSAKNISNGVFNIYISGIDTYGSITTVSRSDVNMILSVNMNTHEILMTSIPRDLYVTLHSYNAKDKLTHSGIYGIDETVTTIEDLMNISINYYVRVNFTSLVTLVDALGGVDVYSDQAMTLNGYNYIEGNNHMSGIMALRFARERHSYATGDQHRTENQQAVLTAIINKMASFSSITNYNSVLSAVEGAFNTNMPANDITTIAKTQIEDTPKWTINHQYVEATGTKMYGLYSMPKSYLYTSIPNEDSLTKCKDAISNVLN